MPLFISRTARIAELRQVLHARSETLKNMPEDTRAHQRLRAECEAISDEIARLQAATGPHPLVLAAVIVAAFIVLLVLLNHPGR